MENKYYVYEWIRLDTNEPFYIGKGCGNRCYKLTREGNKHFNNIVKSIPTAINILHDNLNENVAFGLEIFYIWYYKDIIGYDLCNLTDGGEGYSCRGSLNHKSIKVVCLNDGKIYESICIAQEKYGSIEIKKCCDGIYNFAGKSDELGYLCWKYYDEYIQMTKDEIERYLYLANNSRCGERNSFYNKHHTEETKEKLRQYNLGKKYSEETKQKLSNMRRGKGNCMYGKRGKDNPNYGIKRTEEQKKYLSEIKGTKVRCIELDITFSSLSKAEEYIKSEYNIKFNRRTLVSRLSKYGNGAEYKKIIINNEEIILHWEYI